MAMGIDKFSCSRCSQCEINCFFGYYKIMWKGQNKLEEELHYSSKVGW
jgi:uncharacterized Fe-S center protein